MVGQKSCVIARPKTKVHRGVTHQGDDVVAIFNYTRLGTVPTVPYTNVVQLCHLDGSVAVA